MRPFAEALYGRAYLLLFLTCLMWAGNALMSRLAVGEVSPMALVSLRWALVAALLLWPVRRSLPAAWPILGPRWPYLFAMGAGGFTGFNALFYWAGHHTTAINIGVIQGAIPALVILFGFAAFGTRISGRQLGGLVLTLAGVAAIASGGDLGTLRRLSFNVGDLAMLGASALYAAYACALRSRPPVPPLAFFAVVAGAALVTSLPFLAMEAAAGALRWPTAKGWAVVAYVALFPSLLAQLLFMRGVELIGPARAGLFMNLVPVLAALLAVALLGETFAPHHALALALVLGGIWVAERKPA